MQITINLPEELTDQIGDKWGNLQQKIVANLVLDALKEGLISFDELKKILDFFSDAELKEFLRENNMLHSGGLLNLYGACPDIDFIEDDGVISDGMDDDAIGGF